MCIRDSDDRFSYNTPGTEKEFWRAMAVPLCQRESPLRSHGECARVASPPPHPNTHTKWQSIHCARLLIGPLMHVGMQHSINGCRLISETDVGTSICLRARDGRTMPSASSTVAVVESQPRGDRRHSRRRSLQGESPFVCISEGGAAFSSCLAQRHYQYRH